MEFDQYSIYSLVEQKCRWCMRCKHTHNQTVKNNLTDTHVIVVTLPLRVEKYCDEYVCMYAR